MWAAPKHQSQRSSPHSKEQLTYQLRHLFHRPKTLGAAVSAAACWWLHGILEAARLLIILSFHLIIQSSNHLII